VDDDDVCPHVCLTPPTPAKPTTKTTATTKFFGYREDVCALKKQNMSRSAS